jgi:hypothetical protein
MSKAEDTNVFSSANAIDPIAPKDCIFGCGVKINYDSTLPGASYREVSTGLHHSFKRCVGNIRSNYNNSSISFFGTRNMLIP